MKIAISILTAVALTSPFAACAAERPNIVVFFADDLGYGDIGCYGSVIRTPNIDQLAREGLRFTDFYAGAPNCSPSRTALLTGRTPSRAGVYDYLPPGIPMHLPDSEITIAEALQSIGYATCHVGKWHLSSWSLEPEARLESPTPGDQGFDYWFAVDNNAVPSHRNPENFLRNGEAVGQIEGYSCQIVADEAVDWLETRDDKTKPFFLNVWFNEPHRRIASPRELIDSYDDYPREDAEYFANVTNMDLALGRVLKKLDELGLRDDTFVLFASDNGPWHANSSGPLRAGKSSLYEGGIRVPGVIRWPGQVEPGRVTGEPAGVVDLLPTLLAITGAELPVERHLDGSNILPLLTGADSVTRDQPLFWFFYKSSPMCAIRDGDYVLVADPLETYRSKSHPIDSSDLAYLKSAKMERFELYNVREDIEQTEDLSDREPERLETLKKRLLAIHQDVIAEGPPWPTLPPDTP